MRIPTLILITLAAFPVSASDSAISMPSARSPVVSEFDTRTRAIQNRSAVDSALLIDLEPLPAEEIDALVPKRTSKRRQIGIHRALPDEFTGDLVPHLEWVVDAGGQHTTAITLSAEGAVSLRIAVHAELPPDTAVQVFDGDGARVALSLRPPTSAPTSRSGVPPKLIIFNGFLVGAGAQHCQGQIRQRDRFATTMTIPTRNGDFGVTRAGSEWPAPRAHSTACPNA